MYIYIYIYIYLPPPPCATDNRAKEESSASLPPRMVLRGVLTAEVSAASVRSAPKMSGWSFE